jgi:hypothetical protein
MSKTAPNFFAETSSDLTSPHDSAKSDGQRDVAAKCIDPGEFTMPSVDQTTPQPSDSAGRKHWETPTVIVGSARRETLSNLNTPAVDGTYGGTTSYGS